MSNGVQSAVEKGDRIESDLENQTRSTNGTSSFESDTGNANNNGTGNEEPTEPRAADDTDSVHASPTMKTDEKESNVTTEMKEPIDSQISPPSPPSPAVELANVEEVDTAFFGESNSVIRLPPPGCSLLVDKQTTLSDHSEAKTDDDDENDDDDEKKMKTQQSFATTRDVPNGCAICLCEFEAGDRVTWAANPDCPHVFHEDCVLQWMVSVGYKSHRRRRQDDLSLQLDLIEAITDFPMVCPCCRQQFVLPKDKKHNDNDDDDNDNDNDDATTNDNNDEENQMEGMPRNMVGGTPPSLDEFSTRSNRQFPTQGTESTA